MEKEIRSIDVQFRNESDNRTIDGYALVFNSLSHNLGGFVETISPNALDGVLERSDVVALLNHDNSRGILGRSRFGKGSLKLSVDDHGLRFVVEAPHTSLGDECLEYLRRGDATQCSFAFTVGSDTWTKRDDGTYLRTINSFDQIFDCSILTCTPAYEATSVSCRSFEEFKAEEARKEEEKLAELEKQEQAKREAEEAEKQAKIKEFYDALRKEYQDALKKGDEIYNK